MLTPIEQHGDVWLKRDDLFTVAGACGGKTRACWVLAQGATGLVTGNARKSPQQQIVARISKKLGIPCCIHTASGDHTLEMDDAVGFGAEIIQHRMGFSSVLACRAREDAAKRGWVCIPFGMESSRAVACTAGQVKDIPKGVARIVVVVGSGISVSGIMHGLRRMGRKIPILGVRVGGGVSGKAVERRLIRFAPGDWSLRLTIVQAAEDYQDAVEASICGVHLDSHYEAKAARFVEPGDLFWIIGHRPEVAQ